MHWRGVVLVSLFFVLFLDAGIGHGWRVEQFELLCFFRSKQFKCSVSIATIFFSNGRESIHFYGRQMKYYYGLTTINILKQTFLCCVLH